MTPRVHMDIEAGVRELRRDAETYFPSNGTLLLAVALMTAR
jgi:hypothetical protein